MTNDRFVTAMGATTIWKYRIPASGEIEMPSAAQVLAVGEQALQDFHGGEPVLWAALNPQHPTVIRKFALLATGEQFVTNPLKRYCGTIQTRSGLVWHVVEVLA